MNYDFMLSYDCCIRSGLMARYIYIYIFFIMTGDFGSAMLSVFLLQLIVQLPLINKLFRLLASIQLLPVLVRQDHVYICRSHYSLDFPFEEAARLGMAGCICDRRYP